MNWYPRSPVRLVTLGGAFVTLLAGCHQEPKNPFERYIPSSGSARAGVTSAMEGWLKGLSPEASGSSSSPEVHVVDQTRRADQKLARYEILGEVPAENARAFALRVTYEGTDEPEIVRFIAVGVDPMWIFRREDYEGIWQHQEEAPADRAGVPAKKQ
jgi:hypothetical protein